MSYQESFDKVKEFAQSDPQTFWIIVGIIVVVLYFLFKPKKGTKSNLDMDKFNWQVFQRKNR